MKKVKCFRRPKGKLERDALNIEGIKFDCCGKGCYWRCMGTSSNMGASLAGYLHGSGPAY